MHTTPPARGMRLHLERLSWAAHGLAVASLGLMAGFFGTYAINVSPAMLSMDGLAYVQMQAAFNRHVRHALFFGLFFGPVLWCALAVGAGWVGRRRPWWWAMAAVGLAYGLGIVLFTREVNLPLNALTEGWADAGAVPPQWAEVRLAWNRANLWRTLLSTALFALALAALAWRLRATPAPHA